MSKLALATVSERKGLARHRGRLVSLAIAVASIGLFTGCPEAVNDMRRARAEMGDPSTETFEINPAEAAAEEFACVNLRRWRDDLDTPQYLKDTLTNADDEAKRARLLKDYQKDHESTWVTCRTKLEKDAGSNRGRCPVCTAMLSDPKYQDQRPSGEGGPQVNPIQLGDNQQLAKVIEFRLKWQDSDYVIKDIGSSAKPDESDATAAQSAEASFKTWLASRGADAAQVDAMVALERAKGTWSGITGWTKRPVKEPNSENKYGLAQYGLPPLAEPFVRCPNKDCKTRETMSVGLLESRCWNCNTYLASTPRDLRLALNEPFEELCPFCKKPVDPTSNFCDSCQKFNRGPGHEAPCWRCGGSHVCPECGGSGKGGAPIYGNDDCYLCGGKSAGGTNGACPECDSRGFVDYDGALPATVKGVRARNDWKLSAGTPAVAAPAKEPKDGE